MFYLNGTPLKVTIFPDKTSQVWNLPEESIEKTLGNHIHWEFEQESDIVHLAQLKDLLDTVAPGTWCGLIVKYLPYGRQDKEISNTSTFALRTFAKLLNSLKFNDVLISDPHSKIALDLIDNSRASYPLTEIEKILIETNNGRICYPDKGAVDKYSEKYPYVYVYGEKVRDQLSGKILKYELKAQKLGVYAQSVLIVDDICDGGATFILLAKELYEQGASEVNLFVTHGIFSKGLRPLRDAGIKRIFTQDGEAFVGLQGLVAYAKLF